MHVTWIFVSGCYLQNPHCQYFFFLNFTISKEKKNMKSSLSSLWLANDLRILIPKPTTTYIYNLTYVCVFVCTFYKNMFSLLNPFVILHGFSIELSLYWCISTALCFPLLHEFWYLIFAFFISFFLKYLLCNEKYFSAAM